MAAQIDTLDTEKGLGHQSLSDRRSIDQERQYHPTSRLSRATSALHSFEHTLLKWNVELRGVRRVEDDEKQPITWFAYLQVFVLWTSVNLAINNVTLGMLGPAVFELSFEDSAICAALGALVGALPVAWIATYGPVAGLRTMAFGRYAMGYWPSKLIVVLNIIVFLGYSLLVCIIGGQVLSAVSPKAPCPLSSASSSLL